MELVTQNAGSAPDESTRGIVTTEGATETYIEFDWIWQQLTVGKLFVEQTYYEGDYGYAVVRQRSDAPAPPQQLSFHILERVLRAEQPKCVGDELGRATSTISHHCSVALSYVGAERIPARVSILLVMAIQAAVGHVQPLARLRHIASSSNLLLSAEIPGEAFSSRLSPSEFEVARFTIKGRTQHEISCARGTTMRTTANQLASVYQKLRISGRTELRALAARSLPRLPAFDAPRACSPFPDSAASFLE